MAGLYSVDRGGGGPSHSEERSAAAAGVASEAGAHGGPHPGLLSDVCAWADAGAGMPVRRSGRCAPEGLAELGEIAVVDVVLPTRSSVTIRKRCIGRPTEHQAILLQRLGLALPASLEMLQL